MYISKNHTSKAAIKRALVAGERITLKPAGPFDQPVLDGTVTVEGPWYPQPHRWYGQVTVRGGVVVKIV